MKLVLEKLKKSGRTPPPLSRVLPFEKKGRISVYLLEQENIFYVFIKTIGLLMLTLQHCP